MFGIKRNIMAYDKLENMVVKSLDNKALIKLKEEEKKQKNTNISENNEFNWMQDNKENIGQNYYMKEFQIRNNNTKITIGRSQKCDIVIEDMMLSKMQTFIEYNSNEECFYLYDGDGEKDDVP